MVRLIHQKLGLTQVSLANLTGYSQAHISRWLHHVGNPAGVTAARLRRFVEGLGIPWPLLGLIDPAVRESSVPAGRLAPRPVPGRNERDGRPEAMIDELELKRYNTTTVDQIYDEMAQLYTEANHEVIDLPFFTVKQFATATMPAAGSSGSGRSR